MSDNRFFIRDCNDNIVGNPKGYATFRGAIAQYNNTRSPAYRAAWVAYDARATWYEASCMPLPLRKTNIINIK